MNRRPFDALAGHQLVVEVGCALGPLIAPSVVQRKRAGEAGPLSALLLGVIPPPLRCAVERVLGGIDGED
jgi:hypothetical protein